MSIWRGTDLLQHGGDAQARVRGPPSEGQVSVTELLGLKVHIILIEIKFSTCAVKSFCCWLQKKTKKFHTLTFYCAFSCEANIIFLDLPSPNPLPQLFQQHTAVADWPEQVEFHPYSAEEESELGYMDDPYHEETYEDLLTPSFFSLERDTLQIVEVTHTLTVITKAAWHR